MRGDPEYDAAVDAMYRRERRTKKRKLRYIQAVAALFALLAVVVLFTVDRRPYRLASVPFSLAVLTLRLLDPDWLSLNQRFSIGLVATVLGLGLVRLFVGAL